MWGYTDCRAVADLLWNYTAHRLSEQDIERVEQHLSGCAPCRAEAAAYRQTVDALASMRSKAVPDSQRGWHELRAQLETPERRPASLPRFLGFPALAGWSMAGVAAALLVAFLSPLGSAFRPSSAPDNGSSRLAMVTPGPQAGTFETTPPESEQTDTELSPDDIAAIASDTGEPAHAAGSAAVRLKPMHRAVHRPVQLAFAEPAARHRRNAGSAFHTQSGRALDYSRMDGRRSSSANDNNDYVLTPVSAVSESDSAADYVMGSVVMSGRSSDSEVARGW